MEFIKPEFYHIPRIVADECDPHAAFVFAVVYWFVKMKEGRCFASNERIAQSLPYKSSHDSVGNALATLEEKGFIERVFSDKNKRNRVEIRCLVSYDVQPVGGTRPTPKLDNVQPVGGQNSIRDKEEILGYRQVPVLEEEENPRARKDTAYREVFEVFSKKPQGWMFHKPQIDAAKRLLKMRGIQSVKNAMAFYRENEDEKYALEIDTPFDLEAKWNKLNRRKAKTL